MEVVEDKAIVLEVVRIQKRMGEPVVDILILKDTNFIALIVVGKDIYKRLVGILLVGDTGCTAVLNASSRCVCLFSRNRKMQ